MKKFQLAALFCLCLILLTGCSMPADKVEDYVDQAQEIQDSTAAQNPDTSDQDSDSDSTDQDLTSANILDKKWQLTELNGVAIDAEKAPYFQLSSDSKITGFAGCNNFFGTYEIEQPLQVKFSDLGSTMMFCPDSSQLELDFLALLTKVDNFSLSQDGLELSLNKARMAPLARFSLAE
jgi:heat shock protein HslJ